MKIKDLKRKAVDETRCCICKITVPYESDFINDVWMKAERDGRSYDHLLGFFCNLCMPPSARIDERAGVYVIDRMDY